MRDDDRTPLLFALATFLFVGALRSFLSAVYYDNLVALELGPSALWSLALLAPVAFLIPALARRPRATLIAAAVALALSRALLAPTRGTDAHLPLAATAAAAWTILLGAALPLARVRPAAAAAGVAMGWALDAALLWWADSADPSATLRGLILVVPAGAMLVWLAFAAQRGDAADARRPRGDVTIAAVGLGVWLFLMNTLAANPYGAARWNEVAPTATAAASLVGLLGGALLVARGLAARRPVLLALHAGALLALIDHALLHSRAFPLLLAILAAALVADLALLLPRVTPRALALAGLVALVLHFLYAFTYLFAFVPLGDLWEGQAPALYLVAALALGGAALLRAGTSAPLPARARRGITTLLVAPALVGAVAVATPGADVPEPEGDLRVLSFNVHQGFSNAGVVDAEVFVAVLAEADADIVVLQEADSPRFTSGNLDVGTLLAQRLGYHHVYGQPTSAQAFGGAILSRLPVVDSRAYQLPSTSDDRWYTEARIDLGTREAWVYAVHFALPHEGRIPQAQALLAQAATRSGPTILAGDFNSCPSGLCAGYEEGVSDDVYAQITARYQDAWVAAGHDADDPAGYTYEAGDLHERIDHVYASNEFIVRSAEVVGTEAALRASDHLPVLVVLELQ